VSDGSLEYPNLKDHQKINGGLMIELAFAIMNSNVVYVANYPTKAFVRPLKRAERVNEY